ncbi:MAG: L,D-transpeptidase [Campylobacterota bacterium]|nr:L,D-transpeptidase [Campylobacterota bacterium]
MLRSTMILIFTFILTFIVLYAGSNYSDQISRDRLAAIDEEQSDLLELLGNENSKIIADRELYLKELEQQAEEQREMQKLKRLRVQKEALDAIVNEQQILREKREDSVEKEKRGQVEVEMKEEISVPKVEPISKEEPVYKAELAPKVKPLSQAEAEVDVEVDKKRQITVHIDLSEQEMRVYNKDTLFGEWRVSTAKGGHITPVGRFKPKTLKRMHYSSRYHKSQMPYSIFFKGNYAIHGTKVIKHLGRKASHGCVRLHPGNAKKLYQLVRKYGKKSTEIIITK